MKLVNKLWKSKKAWLPGLLITLGALILLYFLAGGSPDSPFRYRNS